MSATAGVPSTSVCTSQKGLRIPYHNKADGFTAALLLTLNQVKFCELHNCQPHVVWSAFPACKYAGVRFPGRTPFFDASHGTNAFLYFFRPICEGYAKAQQVAPTLTCEQREQVHRVLPWALRTYYYGAARSSAAGGARANETYDAAWYGQQRSEGARLVNRYLRLQPAVASRLSNLSTALLGRDESTRLPLSRSPILGVHLRGTDKGKYLSTAGSGRPIGPTEYEPYVTAFLKAHGPSAKVFVATDSPSYLDEVKRKWPADKLIYRSEVLRHESNVAFVGGKGGGKRNGGAAAIGSGNYRKGEEVLLDALLLSKCDFLLHSASGVAEFAIYWSDNMRLHSNSVHLQYEYQRQVPTWMGAQSSSSSAEETAAAAPQHRHAAGKRARRKRRNSA